MSKRITINLNDITSGVAKIDDYMNDIRDKCDDLVMYLAGKGVGIAKLFIASFGAVYTGQLESGVFYFNERKGVAVVVADVPYAIFVEYGTGVVGSSSPHPRAGEAGWVYDSHGHGESGWTYINNRDGKLHRTTGYVSRPFMMETVQELESIVDQCAKEVFGK